MADPGIYAFSTRKAVLWRGQLQGFSNLYHYSVEVADFDDLNEILRRLKAVEVPVHATNVSFLEGRAWGPVNSLGKGGRMEAVEVFTGTGSVGPDTGYYRELAFLCTWALGRYGTKNRPQFIRKWIHSQSYLGVATAERDGTTIISATPAALTTYMTAVTSLTGGALPHAFDLKTASDHLPIAAGKMYPFLEHREFGR